MFISAERFMYQFVKSIKSNDMVKFKEFFRNTDILLIDDIQFMNGKEAMQEEFFHTFNALLDKGSQIIVSADCPTALAIPLSELSSHRSLVIAGGLQKTEVLRASLKGGYITDLVTDIESAAHILDADNSEN